MCIVAAMDTRERLHDTAEKLALTLTQSGLPKTTSRVMTALLYTEQDTMTAAELCTELSISPRAVSAAIKQLTPSGVIERVPAARSRTAHYRFPNGVWANLMTEQNAILAVMLGAAQEGLDAAAEGTPTAQRLQEMQDFYKYMMLEMSPLVDKWREHYRRRVRVR